MKKKTKYMIVGLVVLSAAVFGFGKAVPAYKEYVLVQHLEAEIKQAARCAKECYNSFVISEREYDKELFAEELHYLAGLMLQLEHVQGEYEWSGSNEIRMAKEVVLLRGAEAENKEYLLKGLEALEENVESDGHGWFLQFYNMNTQ